MSSTEVHPVGDTTAQRIATGTGTDVAIEATDLTLLHGDLTT
jgi:hypothetical protein